MQEPPTAADYAWDAAQSAQRQNASLQEQINELSEQLDQAMIAIMVLAKRKCSCPHASEE